MSIPHVLHQTWKDGEVPPRFQAWQRSWLRQNPAWEYRFWTDASARRFVATHEEQLLPIYDRWPHPIQRVDMARYVWMKVIGGVYADLDFECLSPLDGRLPDNRVVLGLEPHEHLDGQSRAHGLDRIVGNAFIASPPSHPFWDHLLRMIADRSGVTDPLASTGPFLLTKAVETYTRPEELTVLPAAELYPITKEEAWAGRTRPNDRALAIHHWVGTWWRRPPPVREQPRVLIATPIKDGLRHLPRYVENLRRLSHPHSLISVAILESDSTDGTDTWLQENLRRELGDFRSVTIDKVDFGYRPARPRWAPAIQRRRREILAKSRNRLVQRALGDADWVLWIDVDVVQYPAHIIESLLATGKEIVAPHCVGPDGRTFDLNTFCLDGTASESPAHVLDGILQPPRGIGRRYLEDLQDHELVKVDAVGGAMLLVRADHHRDGLIFPSYSHRLYIETEGLAMMAADMGLSCWALPRLRIVHA